MSDFTVTVEKDQGAYKIVKPLYPGTMVKHDGKQFPFLALPGHLGWIAEYDNNSNISHWTTKNTNAVKSILETAEVTASNQIIQEIQSASVTNEMSRAIDGAVLEFPDNDRGYVPRAYQSAGVAFTLRAWDRGVGSICVDEVGLGKTAQALLAALSRIGDGKMLIVCPANVRYNWRKEIMIWWGFAKSPISVRSMFSVSGFRADSSLIDVIDGRRKPRADAKVIICSYSMFSAGELNSSMITKYDYDVAIVDESHYLKKKSSSRSRYALNIKAKYRMCLTATPAEKPADMFFAAHWLDPKTYPDYGTYSTAFPRGQKGVVEINKVLRSSIMYGRKKSDVATDLPPLVFDVKVIDAHIEIDPVLAAHGETMRQLIEEKAIYWQDLLDRDEEKAKPIIKREHMKLMASMGRIKGIHPTEIQKMRVEAGHAKLPFVFEQAENILATGEKLIIGYHHKVIGKHLLSHMDTLEYSTAMIDGSTPAKEREAIREQLDAGEVDCILASITATSTGINLQSANNIIMAEVDWSGANNYQFAGRIHRINQELPCLVMIPVVKGSIEQHVLSVQGFKQQMLSIIQEV